MNFPGIMKNSGSNGGSLEQFTANFFFFILLRIDCEADNIRIIFILDEI